MKTIGITANFAKPEAGAVVRQIARLALKSGLEIVADRQTARFLGRVRSVPLKSLPDCVDAVVAVGGDGTMLRAARELAGRDVPMIGVKMGGLGFLTSVGRKDVSRALSCLARDKFMVSVRTVAECRIRKKGGRAGSHRAVNDVVVAAGQSARVLTLEVSIDGRHVTSYVCDGVIVSTPTGSTGHSLSAGGPIVTPDTSVFVVSLICPHTLTSRPLVVPDSSVISVRVARCDGSAKVSVDGQVNVSARQGDKIEIRRSNRHVKFIHLPGYDYFSVLRQKLHWSGSAV